MIHRLEIVIFTLTRYVIYNFAERGSASFLLQFIHFLVNRVAFRVDNACHILEGCTLTFRRPAC